MLMKCKKILLVNSLLPYEKYIYCALNVEIQNLTIVSAEGKIHAYFEKLVFFFRKSNWLYYTLIINKMS